MDNEDFDEVTFHFMVAGHTKFSPDRMFGYASRQLKKRKLLEVDDVVDAINEGANKSYSATELLPKRGGDDSTVLLNWKEALSGYAFVVKDLNKYHWFRAAPSEDSGRAELFVKKRASDEWSLYKRPRSRKTQSNATPDDVSPSPLPLKQLTKEKLRDFRNCEELLGGITLSYAHPDGS